MNIEKIWNDAKNDPTLVSNINVDDLLKASENERVDFLSNKTVDDLFHEKYNTIENYYSGQLSTSDITKICDKLANYRYVDDIYQFDRGRHIRWMRKINNSKTIGAKRGIPPFSLI